MRAAYPDISGYVDRAGVQIYYEVFENDAPSLLFIPPSPITHSRIFKAQIPYLSRTHRIVTFDGRGAGHSSRVSGVDWHTRAENVADARAVLDATGTDEAILVAHCHANWWAMELAAGNPDRVAGWVAIDPGLPYIGTPHRHWQEAGATWTEILDDPKGWQLFNRHVITTRHRDWIEFFFRSQLVEPHSTKQFEDAVAWALESTGEILADSEEAQEIDPPTKGEFVASLESLDLPVLVVHGEADVCQHVDKGRDLAAITGGDLLVVAGGGHLTLARDPVRVNMAISRFLTERMAA